MGKKDKGRLSITPIVGDGPVAFNQGTYGTRVVATRPDDYDPSHDNDRQHLDAEERLPLDLDHRTLL